MIRFVLTAALLLAPGLLAAAPVFPELEVEQLSCDSLRISGQITGWSWLEADEGAGFTTLSRLDGGRIQLTRPLPPFGQSHVWRYARQDSLGLPDYSAEQVWTRPFPSFTARLDGTRISGKLVDAGSTPCLPTDLLLRVEQQGRVIDLQRIPATAAFSHELGTRDFSALSLGWAGQNATLRLVRPGAEPSRSIIAGEGESLLAAPELIGLDETGLLLRSALPLELTAGEGKLEAGAEPGTWRLQPAGSVDLRVVSRAAAGQVSLPFQWEMERIGLQPQVERIAADALRVGMPANEQRQGLELAWLDGAGRQGRLPLDSGPQVVTGLSGFCVLQVLEEGGESLWRQRLDLEWPAPANLVAASRSDTLLLLNLQDERGWSRVWEVEWRDAGAAVALRAAESHQILPHGAEMIWLRWRAGLAPARSRWSPWRELSLVPDPPQQILARPEPGGISVSWLPGTWLSDRVELLRISDGDSLSRMCDAAAGSWLDPAPGDRLVEYRLRMLCSRRGSAWSDPVFMARPADAVAGNPVGLARSLVSQAEYAAFAQDQNLPPSNAVEDVEGSGGRPDSDSPALHISSREAMAYCNWLNDRLQLDGRYELATGTWEPGQRGGMRLPDSRDYGIRPARPTGLRHWVLAADGAHAAGQSPLRPEASVHRPYSLEARQPDVGLLLVRESR